MALPAGFDPITGTFKNVPKPRIQSNYNPTFSSSNSSHRRYGLGKRINDVIKSIGNWIDGIIGDVSGWLSLIVAIIGVIGLLIWVFSDLKILNIILRFVGACLLLYVLRIVIAIILVCVVLIMKVIRYVFWNIWTLLISLALIIGCYIYTTHDPTFFNLTPTIQTDDAPKYDKYRCTANSLNVRSQPTQNSQVLGTLRKGQEVEVTNIENGFATIEYNGQKGYVSLKYLNKVSD